MEMNEMDFIIFFCLIMSGLISIKAGRTPEKMMYRNLASIGLLIIAVGILIYEILLEYVIS